MRQRVGATATPFHPLGETLNAVGVPFDLLGETLDAVDIGREHLPDIDLSPMSTASKDSSSEPDGTQTASKVLPNGWNAAAGEHPTCCWDGRQDDDAAISAQAVSKAATVEAAAGETVPGYPSAPTRRPQRHRALHLVP